MSGGDTPSADIVAQREYYSRTARQYDDLQIDAGDEHAMALAWVAWLIETRGYASVLDVGSGTGRALLYLKQRSPITLVGVEPSEDLRKIGHGKGLSETELVGGDALALAYQDDSFDLVCAFGVLHHIGDHGRAVAEMRRVAKRAIFISDANNYGQGSALNRLLKQTLRALGLWRAFDYVRTGFKGYHYSEGDGIFYSYSLFEDLPILESKFPATQFMSTRPSGANLYRSAQTIAVFATRSDVQGSL